MATTSTASQQNSLHVSSLFWLLATWAGVFCYKPITICKKTNGSNPTETMEKWEQATIYPITVPSSAHA